MRWMVLLCWTAAALADPVQVSRSAGGLVVETGALQAVIGPDGRIVALGRPGGASLMADPAGWNPGLSVSLWPTGKAEPVNFDETRAKAAAPQVVDHDFGTRIVIEQRWEPWLSGTKTLTFAPGGAAVRIRYDLTLLQPVRMRRLGITLVSSRDADALAAPAPAGSRILADQPPGKYFRTPAADEQAGFDDFRRERWLALLARGRDEGLAVLFPDLAGWGEFRKQYNLASKLKDGGYVLEFADPRVPGNDTGGPGYRDYPAGTRFSLELALTPFAGEAAAAARAALAALGAPIAPSYPVRATAFPTHLTAASTGGVPTFHLLPGLPLAPAFGFAGDRDAAGELTLVVELPADVSLRQACYLHPGLRQALPLQPEASGETSRQRFRLPVPARVIGKTEPTWAGVLATFLEPRQGFTNGAMVYWLEGKAGKSAESTVQLVALPPLEDAPRPREFELFPWYQMTLSCPDQGVRAAQIAALERLGARTTSYHGLDRLVARELKERGWKLVLGMGWSDRGPYGFQLHNYGRIDWPKRGYPEEVWIVDHQGQRHVGVFCPSYAAQRGALFVKEYRAWLAELIDDQARELCSVVSNDFEPGETGLMGARHSCFCTRCRHEFATRLGVAPETLPDAATILGSHLAAWTDYRMDIYASLIGFHTEVVRDLAPGMVNSICSHWVPDPPGSEIWPGEAVDVRRFDPHADQHTPMMYHGGTRLLDNLARTREHLSKPLVVLTAAFYDAWSSATVVFSPAEVRWNLVAIGSLGAQGAGFYASLDHCDGAYLHAIQAALTDLAKLDDDLRGTRVEAGVTGLGQSARAYRLRGAGRELVALFNADGRQPATAMVATPPGWRAVDALSGMVPGVTDGRVAVEIPATSYRFVVLTAP